MKQKQNLIKIILFFFVVISTNYGQFIHSLPNQAIFQFPPDTNEVYSAFNIQHELSEILYAAGKIEAPIDSVYPPILSTTDFWSEGSWGRGYYTQIVEYQPGNEDFRYEQWYSPIDTTENGNIRYAACYPLIRDTGRRLIGYINAIKNVHYPTDFDNLDQKIKDGIEHLLNVEQNSNGSFNWYRYRASQDNTENSGVQENVYPTSIALRALCEGFSFINDEMNDASLNVQIINGIESASTWLIDYNLDIPGYNHGNINMKYHAVWGLVGAYKITGNTTYYNTAKAIALTSFDYQRDDGSWETPISDQTEPCIENITYKKWHDTRIYYHGMILRGLSELYSIVENDGNFKNQLKERIVRSINHVIDYNGVPPDSDAPNSRLYSPNGIHDGRVFIIHRDEVDKDCDPVIGNKGIDGQILNGLVSTRNHVGFNNEDTERLDQLINYIANGMANWINNVSYTKRVWHSDQKLMGLGKYIGKIKSVILSNRDLSEYNLYGSLSIDNVSIPSGNSHQFLSYKNDLHDLWTDEPELDGKIHINWNDEYESFKLNQFDLDLSHNGRQTAYFDNQHTIPINSNLNIPILIQDPWYLRNPDDPPAEWIQTGNDWLDANGQYSVFLNQNEDLDPDLPIYSLKTPLYVGQLNGIFQFTHWSGNDVLFNGNSTSNELLTNVVFLTSESHVTANYDLNNPLNLQPGALFIPPDETLIIYADSDISFASTTSYVDNPFNPIYTETEGFRLYVQGKLIVENNVKLKKSGNGLWGGIVLEPDGILEMNGALIEDAFIGINIPDPGENFLDTIYSKIERCVFKDNAISLLYINNSNCGYSHPTVEINNNTFYNNEFTVFTHSFADPDDCDIPKPSSNLKIIMNNNIIANSQIIYSLIDTMNYNFFFNTPVSEEIEALGEGNVENGTDPLFVNPQSGDFHLSFASPCRDAGHPDLDGDGVMWQNDPDDQDPDGTRMDMGAFYYELPSTYLSFHLQMSVGDNPRLVWTPVNVGVDIYYDIYYHIANSSSLIYLATTQSITYTDLRYIVTEIEEATNERRIKVKKNQLYPPEQATMRVYYTIVVRDGDGHLSPPSNDIMARVINAPNPKEMAELLPEKYDLSQGYPNPFNPTITLPYALPDLSTVVIHVYDITGRRVATLKNQMQKAGYHKIRWDGRNKTEKPLSSGMYIIQMTAKSMEDGELFTKAQKVVLLK